MKWNDLIQYIVLVCILTGGIATFYYVRPNASFQFTVGVITSVAYVIWGCIYHGLKKDLHIRVVIEYVLMGAIAVVLLATVLNI